MEDADGNPIPEDENIRILILQRGWVVVGRFSQEGTECRITNGYIIRRWGSSAGLGQLAAGGPRDDTILDPITTLCVHELGIVASLFCNPKHWTKRCR